MMVSSNSLIVSPVRLFGSFVTLFVIQAKGWPFIIFMVRSSRGFLMSTVLSL